MAKLRLKLKLKLIEQTGLETRKTTAMTYTQEDLNKRYEGMTGMAQVEAVFVTELVGGQPAEREGVEAFVHHHLKLTGPEAEQAIARILSEEIDLSKETGVEPVTDEVEVRELKETLTYGLTVIRRDEHGPWLGDWMVKACLKSAASRLGLFVKVRGAKGDMAQMGRVKAINHSLLTPRYPERIHLVNESGTAAPTVFRTFRGRISGPKGSVSIISDKECALVGARFAFEFRWFDLNLTESQVVDIFSAATNIGLGSCKAFERGKFHIELLDVECKTQTAKAKKSKREDTGGEVTDVADGDLEPDSQDGVIVSGAKRH